MSARRKVFKLAAKLDVMIDDEIYPNGSGGCITAAAPDGHRFAMVDVHAVCAEWFTGEKEHAWERTLRDLEGGIEPCPKGGDFNCWTADCSAMEVSE
jgi:hypothetical protein